MSDPDRFRAIHRAVTDPGSITARTHMPGPGARWESRSHWQARAVLEVIGQWLGSPGAQRIVAERSRQVEAEGYTPEHDARHQDSELARAAAVYALHTWPGCGWSTGQFWPRAWTFKPGADDDPVATLVKAGALIAAEIDRLLEAGA